jgi:large subunit ribosomal protein L35
VPKMKTHRGAAKRFKGTGGGRFKRNQGYHGHLGTHKSAKKKRQLRQSTLVDRSDEGRLRRLLPYS